MQANSLGGALRHFSLGTLNGACIERDVQSSRPSWRGCYAIPLQEPTPISSGRTLAGPIAATSKVITAPRTCRRRCSTGEQKALLIGLILAQAERSANTGGHSPSCYSTRSRPISTRPPRGPFYEIWTSAPRPG